jgi:hypothetical protein
VSLVEIVEVDFSNTVDRSENDENMFI